MSGTLILLRHGESVYNKENLFTGWTDVELSEKGIDEAKKAGESLKRNDIYPDICFSSWLKRSIHTAQLALKMMKWEHIDLIKSWKLNERHYGEWQGRNKKEIENEVGEELFFAVRRGYSTPPPALDKSDQRSAVFDTRYKSLDPDSIPLSESLEDTRKRTLSYYYEYIVPQLCRGKTVLVSAHGNSLRSLTMEVEKLSPEEVSKVEIPTGTPIVYSFDETMGRIGKKRFH